MSHYTVMLRISAERLARHGDDVDAAVAEMLAPYDENSQDSRYVEFIDEEEVARTKYETEGAEVVRLEDGSFASRYAERFRVPHKQRFSSFEEYMKERWGYSERDAKMGRYGYWRNPNAKWDWYAIGGRWSGKLPVKSLALSDRRERGEKGVLRHVTSDHRHADALRVREVDMDAVTRETLASAEEFWVRWEMYKRSEVPLGDDGSPDAWFNYDVREHALRLGLLVVVQTDEAGKLKASPDGFALDTREWKRAEPPRNLWADALSPIERHAFLSEYIDAFCPLVTYAALDDDGWHAPGRMGWFGCSSDTPDEAMAFKREFVRRFVKSASPDTTLVVVDCHI